MKLVAPSVPAFDLTDWARRPERERVRMMCESWALEGFGAPFAAYALYVLKILAYVWVWVLFVARNPEVAGWADIGQWWATAAALQKAIIWTMLFEVLGLGCGSGPLTARYIPPFVAFTHFLRPGTIRLPPWPDRVPLTAGDRRGLVDVVLYAALLAAGFRALWSPGALAGADLLPMVVLLPLLGLRDKTIFLAARAEHYWTMLLVFLLAGSDTTVLFAGAVFVQVAIWWGAATSKLNHHFPSVVAIMVSNSPLPHPRALRRAMYRSYPDDLRPSRLAAGLAHGGTAIEFLFPLLLLLGDGGALTTVALVVMFCFHLFITTSFPMGVPIEWNVLFVYSMFVLFGAHPEVSLLDLTADPLLFGLLVLGLLVGPVLGNLRPDLVSFLPSMRYYAGNWAASTWLFAPGAEAELDEHLTKTAPTISRQLAMLYDEDTAAALKGKVRAFRSMHLHGRAFNAVLNDVVEDPDAWEITDGEPVAGVALGWNFGDGHLHHEQLLAALQARCRFAPGQVRVIALESQPFHRPTMRWRLLDAADGVLASGEVHTADLLDHQPFPEPGTIDLHRDETPLPAAHPCLPHRVVDRAGRVDEDSVRGGEASMAYEGDTRSPIDAWRDRGRGEVVARLRATPDQVTAVLAEHDGPWDRRVDGQWSPVDVVCHLRDIEELTLARYRAVLRMQDPLLPAAVDPDDREGWGLLEEGARLLDPDRWAHDRQYLRNDIHEAAAAFTRWRRQSDQLLSLLDDAQWGRTSIHPRLGRITLHDWAAIIAWHDGNHVAQLELAVRAG